MDRLSDEELRGAVRINWNVGGLHFSQKQEIISPIGPKSNFINVSIAHMFRLLPFAAETLTRSGDVCKLIPKPVKLCLDSLHGRHVERTNR